MSLAVRAERVWADKEFTKRARQLLARDRELLDRLAMSVVTHADDPETFETEVVQATLPVVVKFWAGWCGPCRRIAPELEALAAERADVKVVKVDVDANPSVAAHYGIQGIPTIALFRDGRDGPDGGGGGGRTCGLG